MRDEKNEGASRRSSRRLVLLSAAAVLLPLAAAFSLYREARRLEERLREFEGALLKPDERAALEDRIAGAEAATREARSRLRAFEHDLASIQETEDERLLAAVRAAISGKGREGHEERRAERRAEDRRDRQGEALPPEENPAGRWLGRGAWWEGLKDDLAVDKEVYKKAQRAADRVAEERQEVLRAAAEAIGGGFWTKLQERDVRITGRELPRLAMRLPDLPPDVQEGLRRAVEEAEAAILETLDDEQGARFKERYAIVRRE